MRWHDHRAREAVASGVFFALLFWAVPVSTGTLEQDCAPPGPLLSVRVSSVVDGDTLRLSDGTRVRFLGVDAPELGRDGRPDEPLARAARDAVQAALADRSAGLVFDSERRDRYGRSLAYVYTSRGESLEALLLRQGLAFHVALPPNLALADCLARQQAEARAAGLGVWSEPYWQARPAASLTPEMAGFTRIRGRIVTVSVGRDIWLELDGPVVLRIAAADRAHFGVRNWQALAGRSLEVQGWLVDRTESRAAQEGFKPLMLAVRTPHAWRFAD